MDCKTLNIRGGICPIIFGAALSLKCVSHQKRMNSVMSIFSDLKKMSHQDIWFGGNHKNGLRAVTKKGQDLIFESVVCVLYSLLVTGHGRGWVVTWEEGVQ